MNKFKRLSPKLYIGITIIYLVFVISSLFTVPELKRSPSKSAYTDVTDEFYYQVGEGVMNPFTFTQNNNPEPGRPYHLTCHINKDSILGHTLLFSTRNCLVTVSVDDTVIYKTSLKDESQTADYIGVMSHFVTIPTASADGLLDICLTPVTDYDAELIDRIYSGLENDVLVHMVKENLFPVLVSLLIAVLGIIVVVFGSITSNKHKAQTLIYLGIFSFCFGIFSIVQLPILTLFFRKPAFLYTLKLLTLAFLPYPLIHCIMLSTNTLPSYKRMITEATPLLYFLLIIINHVLGIFPLNQIKPFIIYAFLFFVLGGLAYLIKYLISCYRTRHLKNNISRIFYSIFLITLTIELIVYICVSQNNRYLILSYYVLFALLIVVITNSAQEFSKFINIGANALTLENAAYVDSLTELNNRTALNRDMDELEKSLNKNTSIAIIQMDLNFLKRTNDMLGHIAGDRLLKNAADAIHTGFEEYGKCYRFGGDEFIVILIDHVKEKYNLGISAMENACERINGSLPLLEHVSIAYGIAYYEPESDTSLWRVQERADAAMYEHKRIMKQKHAPNNNYKDDRL